MSDRYISLVEAADEVKEFGVHDGTLVGLVLVARAIDSLADEVNETNRLLTIIATNTGNIGLGDK